MADLTTVANIRDLSSRYADVDVVKHSQITDAMGIAKQVVYVDLAPLMTVAEIDALGSTDNVLELLAKYKSAQKLEQILYGLKRDDKENTDYLTWQDLYNSLLNKIMSGKVTIDSVITAIGTDVPGIVRGVPWGSGIYDDDGTFPE